MAITKAEIIKIAQAVGKVVDQKLKRQDVRIAIQITNLEQKIDDKFIDFKSDVFDKLDDVMKEVETNREERTIMNKDIEELQETVFKG